MLEIEHFVDIIVILRDQWVTQKIGDYNRDDLRSSIELGFRIVLNSPLCEWFLKEIMITDLLKINTKVLIFYDFGFLDNPEIIERNPKELRWDLENRDRWEIEALASIPILILATEEIGLDHRNRWSRIWWKLTQKC